MKALINQKVEKKKISVPNLCSCGSLAENVKSYAEDKTTGFQATYYPCANNCPFYKNPKEYKKALNDLINSLN